MKRLTPSGQRDERLVVLDLEEGAPGALPSAGRHLYDAGLERRHPVEQRSLKEFVIHF